MPHTSHFEVSKNFRLKYCNVKHRSQKIYLTKFIAYCLGQLMTLLFQLNKIFKKSLSISNIYIKQLLIFHM